MKYILECIKIWVIIGLFSSASALEIDPIPNQVEHPVQSYQNVELEQLGEWGIAIRCEDAGGGDYAVYVNFRQSALKEVAAGDLHASFSLWTNAKDFVLSMPDFDLSESSFMMRDGYLLRMLINTQGNSLGLRPGVGYVFDINPKELIVKKSER